MGMFDEMYNVVPSPYTGVVYPRVQTKDLTNTLEVWSFNDVLPDSVTKVGKKIIRAYTIDFLIRNLIPYSGSFSIFYKIENSRITSHVKKVVAEAMPRLMFFAELATRDCEKREDVFDNSKSVVVLLDNALVWSIYDANYTDVLLFLSLLALMYRKKNKTDIVIKEKKGEENNTSLFVNTPDGVLELRIVNSYEVPFQCKACGNITRFTTKGLGYVDCTEGNEGNHYYGNAMGFWYGDVFGVWFYKDDNHSALKAAVKTLEKLRGETLEEGKERDLRIHINDYEFFPVDVPKYKIMTNIYVQNGSAFVELMKSSKYGDVIISEYGEVFTTTNGEQVQIDRYFSTWTSEEQTNKT